MLVAVKNREVILGAGDAQEALLRNEYQKTFGEAPDGVYTLVGSLSDGHAVEIDADAGTATVVKPPAMTTDDEFEARKVVVRQQVIDLGFDESAVDQFLAENPLNPS